MSASENLQAALRDKMDVRFGPRATSYTKGGNRKLAAFASQLCRDTGSRRLGDVDIGFLSALPHDRKETQVAYRFLMSAAGSIRECRGIG